MLDMTRETKRPIFDYRVLRLFMGVIALSLPYAVIFLSQESLTSVSASYYTDARDTFVGMMFVVGAFLWAYNGHTLRQAAVSKVASLAAFFVGFFPTACDGCAVSAASITHFSAAAVLLSALAYFCLGPFREKTRGQPGKAGRRAVIYLVCGWAMVAAMLIALAAWLFLEPATVAELRIVFWVELVALNAFGIAWITAGKLLPILVDKDEAVVVFGQRSA